MISGRPSRHRRALNEAQDDGRTLGNGGTNGLQPDASQATPEVDRTRERPPWVVTIVAWVVTIVALVVAAVSVTLLLTDDGPGGAGDPEPTPAGATIPAIQTVEANVMCRCSPTSRSARKSARWTDAVIRQPLRGPQGRSRRRDLLPRPHPVGHRRLQRPDAKLWSLLRRQ